MPRLILNAEYDDLRPSGGAFAAALALAGVDVRRVRVQTMCTDSQPARQH